MCISGGKKVSFLEEFFVHAKRIVPYIPWIQEKNCKRLRKDRAYSSQYVPIYKLDMEMPHHEMSPNSEFSCPYFPVF